MKSNHSHSSRAGGAQRNGTANNGASNRTKTGKTRPSKPRTSGRSDVQQTEKCKVAGARRVWGPFRLCSPNAVLGCIRKLTNSAANLTIKRKTKDLANSKTIWWFVIHGDEQDLCTLDGDWDKVHLQTNWRLEHCYAPSKSTNDNQNAGPIPSSSACNQLPLPPTQPNQVDQSAVSIPTCPNHNESSTDDTPGIPITDDSSHTDNSVDGTSHT